MRATQVLRYGQMLKVMDHDIPIRSNNQLLIRVFFAPIHPADIYFCRGMYGYRNPLPSPVGFEGVGIIKDADDQEMINKQVAFLPSQDSPFGSWSQYTLTDNQDVIEIPDHHTDYVKEYACAMINPFTALGFLDIVKNNGHKNVLFSSCSSTISIMALRMFRQLQPNIKLIAMKRTANSVPEEISKIGGITIFDLEDPELLNKLSLEFQSATTYFDSLAGPLSGKVLHFLPKGSTLVSYGSSSMTHIGTVDPQDLIFSDKTIQGFWMHKYYHSLKQSQKTQLFRLIQENILEGQIFNSPIAKVFSLEEIENAFHYQKDLKGQGKILLEM